MYISNWAWLVNLSAELLIRSTITPAQKDHASVENAHPISILHLL